MSKHRLRIGVVRHFFETDHRASDATRAGIDAAMDFFRQEGAEVRDITLSPAADYHAVGYLLMITEAFGERSLRRALSEYVEHFHTERNHQGKANVLLFPRNTDRGREGPVRCRERWGGLLRYYHREAA